MNKLESKKGRESFDGRAVRPFASGSGLVLAGSRKVAAAHRAASGKARRGAMSYPRRCRV